MSVLQEIELSDIVRIESRQNWPLTEAGETEQWNHVFEIHCTNGTIYYVGEDPEMGKQVASGARGVVRSVQSGSGLDLARCWETAIRQARLPLSLNDATSSAAGASLAVVETSVSNLKLESE